MSRLARYPGPIVLGHATERLCAVPSGTSGPIVPSNMRAVVTGLEDVVLVPPSLKPPSPGAFHDAVPDGTRGAVLPGLKVEVHGRTFLVGLKGVGARHPMYDAGPLEDGPQGHVFTSESWFGENPWGAMSEKACQDDRAVTELMGPDGINGFHICPMARANALPEWVMQAARPLFWYRRLNGPMPYYQEVRLMPSDVRLFYQSEAALGPRTSRVLEGFRVQGNEDLDGFIDNYIRSGMAALTLAARTARAHKAWGHAALDYDDVWLDKDSVIAPDGTIFFADIEGLDWVPLRDEAETSVRIRKQFDRNFYEFMYGLDRLLNERDRMSERHPDREARRQEVAARLGLALDRDHFITVEKAPGHLDAVIRPAAGPVKEVRARILDFESVRAHNPQREVEP